VSAGKFGGVGTVDTAGSIGITVSGPSGAGVFQSSTYGNYELTIAKDGFNSAVFQAIQVETARVTSINARRIRISPP
jgi:hypothetical protein